MQNEPKQTFQTTSKKMQFNDVTYCSMLYLLSACSTREHPQPYVAQFCWFSPCVMGCHPPLGTPTPIYKSTLSTPPEWIFSITRLPHPAP